MVLHGHISQAFALFDIG
jgi:hypothetical protein